jgi:hypothetical protein
MKRRDLLEDLGIGGRKILKCISKKFGWELWTGFNSLSYVLFVGLV